MDDRTVVGVTVMASGGGVGLFSKVTGFASVGEPGDAPHVIRLSGAWTTANLERLEQNLDDLDWPEHEHLTFDASGIEEFDTGGAWLFDQLNLRLIAQGRQLQVRGLHPERAALLELVRERFSDQERAAPPKRVIIPERIGRAVWHELLDGISLLSFLGQSFVALFKTIRRPTRLRWKAIVSVLETAGVDAVPIIALLSFLLGVVISYQAGIQLQTYGANIFIVELVSLTMVRELAPLIAAIIIAGRTGSAYTAEIGTMRVTEEVDALETVGIGPIDLLVLPKVLGLIVALPLLTVLACASGVFGGMVMAQTMLDVSFAVFLDRLPEVLSLTSFLVGVGKAPAFALIIAMVGCFQGFCVSGGADSVGRQTTVSVVHSIFLVIVADAAFSIVFSFLGV